MSMSPPSICFVGQRAYDVLTGDKRSRHIGGAESQQAQLARALAARGHRVSFIVFDHGQTDTTTSDGIRLIRSYDPSAGIRGLRFFHPRLTGLWSALGRADADVYYQRAAEAETGLVAAWCRKRGRRFLFALAGHHVLLPESPTYLDRRERWLCRYGMNRADLIVVQSEDQRRLLRERLGLDSELLRNGYQLPDRHDGASPGTTERRSGILWVGRFEKIKRLEWCLEVAERLPDVPFTIVGSSNRTSASSRACVERAEKSANVTLAGYVPPDQISRYYRTAELLLCTSISEGFSNAFLEGWACGTPLVTSSDPDGVTERHGLGAARTTIDGLTAAITELRRDRAGWQACSERCMAYVREFHDLERTVDQLQAYLDRLAGSARKPENR